MEAKRLWHSIGVQAEGITKPTPDRNLGRRLRLCLFAVVAWICLAPLYLPLGLVEGAAHPFDELGLLAKIGIVVVYIGFVA